MRGKDLLSWDTDANEEEVDFRVSWDGFVAFAEAGLFEALWEISFLSQVCFKSLSRRGRR